MSGFGFTMGEIERSHVWALLLVDRRASPFMTLPASTQVRIEPSNSNLFKGQLLVTHLCCREG
jgi:hypothetical protein